MTQQGRFITGIQEAGIMKQERRALEAYLLAAAAASRDWLSAREWFRSRPQDFADMHENALLLYFVQELEHGGVLGLDFKYVTAEPIAPWQGNMNIRDILVRFKSVHRAA
ncbi:hypothetical protein [Radicibacter daui]|uniref:hypothetical protein n=1 Tax=Radicibacter daui TaxID=3064829 RepID=UPI004046FFDF